MHPVPSRTPASRRGRVPRVPEDLFAELRLLKRALAVMECRLDARHTPYAADLRAQAERLEGVCEHLRAFVEVPAAARRLELHEIAERVVARFRGEASRSGLRMSYRAAGEPVWVKGDADALGDALSALVSNAIKFTPSGSVSVSIEATRDTARLVVEDTGIGLSAEALERLVRPFEQGSPGDERTHGGLGLGLALADRTARRFGGSLRVEPYAAGSRVVLSFALAAAPGLRRAA